jgi:7-cyano-7-deazaguanine reductase|tara:strand:- start:4986 stop:5405 length:420 start_codon:yes stop_codon:yes gene_type:complete
VTSVKNLQEKYENLDIRFRDSEENVINSNLIMCFDYEYNESGAEVVIDTDEFTAVCPWTRLPDFGTLTISYVPNRLCLELKSLKYYLLSYSGVEIVQEHAANKILEDLASACNPFKMSVKLDYKIRGGLHTTVKVELGD